MTKILMQEVEPKVQGGLYAGGGGVIAVFYGDNLSKSPPNKFSYVLISCSRAARPCPCSSRTINFVHLQHSMVIRIG